MASPTEKFFSALSESGHDPSLGRVTATIEYDIRRSWHREPDRYVVTVDHGQLAVADGATVADDTPVDCWITVDRTDFDAMVNADLDPIAAWLRGLATVEGDHELLMVARRLFSAANDPAATQRRGFEAVATYLAANDRWTGSA